MTAHGDPPAPATAPLRHPGHADQTLYEVELSAVPSAAWHAAFLRPPATLTTATYTPELGRLGLAGARVTFRTTPPRLHGWLRQIDTWIEYANSVVEE